MNGKQFESWIKDSAYHQSIDCTRLKDAGWQGEQTERRFTVTNICDFILFDGHAQIYLEAKKRKQSIRFDELKHQDKLLDKYKIGIPNLAAGYLILFEGKAPVWLDAGQIEMMKYQVGKKSFNHGDAIEHGGMAIETYLPKRARKERMNLKFLMNWVAV